MSAVTHMTLYYNVTTSFEIFEVNVSARKVNGHVHMCAKVNVPARKVNDMYMCVKVNVPARKVNGHVYVC
jgi:hypothetical protein